jgi:hypothetical protein
VFMMTKLKDGLDFLLVIRLSNPNLIKLLVK